MDLASLQIEIDSRRAQQAKKDLESLAGAAEKTEAATDSLSKANQEGEDRYHAIARAALEHKAALDAEVQSQMTAGGERRKVTSAMRDQWEGYSRIASAENEARLASERQAKAMADAAAAAEENRSSLQRLMGQIDPLESKLDRLDEMERQLTQSFRQGVVDLEAYSVAMAKIHGQRSDIANVQMKQIEDGADRAASSMEALGIHTATARYNMLMLGRAAATGDMRMASSSILQLSTRTSLLSAAARAALGPVGLLVGAVTGLYWLYEKGAQETRNYNKALIETGNIVGATSHELSGMARSIAENTGTIGGAASVLAELARSSGVAKKDLEAVAAASINMAGATGRSVSEMVSEFANLAHEPLRGIETLNDRYNYLTLATYDQIRALSEQGREQDAVSLAVRAHADMMNERAPQIAANIGTIERAWASAKSAVSGYIDAAKGIGRQRSLEAIQADIADYDARISQHESSQSRRGSIMKIVGPDADKQLEALKARRALYVRELQETAKQIKKAEDDARYQGVQNAGIAGSRILAEAAMRGDKAAQKAAEIASVQRAATQAIMAAASDISIGENARNELISKLQNQEIAALADIEKRYAEKPTGSSRTRIDEGQRLIDQMNERLGLIGKESEYEKMLAQIQGGRYSDLVGWQKEVALDLAQQLDTATRQIETERILKDLREQQSITQRQFMRDLESFGQSDSMRALNDDLARVEDRYRSIIETRRSSPLGLSDAELEQIRESLEVELNMVRDYHMQKKTIQEDWRLGAVAAVRDYVEEAENLYGSMGGVVTNAFQGMENALTDFVVTGKASFGDFANSIVKEMIRMAVQAMILAPLMRAMGFSGGGFVSGASYGTPINYGASTGFTVSPFFDGGFTGYGGKYEPAGIVHRGEGVLNQEEIRALGGEAGFNALRKSIRGPGHALGGMGGRPSLPPLPTPATGAGDVNVTVNISDKGGAQVNAPAGMEGVAREIGQFVEAKIREHEVRSRRQGGVAWQAKQGAFS